MVNLQMSWDSKTQWSLWCMSWKLINGNFHDIYQVANRMKAYNIIMWLSMKWHFHQVITANMWLSASIWCFKYFIFQSSEFTIQSYNGVKVFFRFLVRNLLRTVRWISPLESVPITHNATFCHPFDYFFSNIEKCLQNVKLQFSGYVLLLIFYK